MQQTNRGQTLIELLLAIALMAAIMPALATALITSREAKPQNERRTQAYQLMREEVEAIKIIKDAGWSGVQTNGIYHPEIAGSTWALVAGDETINGVTRNIVISDVYRDQNQVITQTEGTLDPSTKLITLNLSWTQPIANNISSSLYITRFNDNAVYIQTTENDFSTGTLDNVAITNTNDGEIVLGAGGSGNWCDPQSFIVDELDLPGNGDAKDVQVVAGYAITGTHQSSGGNYLGMNISNGNPPEASVAFSLPGYKTNDVFYADGYAYFATENINRDVVIVDTTTGQEVGYYDDPNLLGTAQGVFVKGNIGYVTIGFRLHTFDLSSKNGSRPQLDSAFLGFFSTGYRLYVVDDYAYVAVDFGSQELGIYHINPNGYINKTGYANVNGASGREVYVNESATRAYLATTSDSNKDEFFIIDISNKNGSRPVISSYNANGMNPTGVTLATFNKAILVGNGGEEYQVIDIADKQNPIRCGGLDVNEGIWGVSAVLEQDGEAYSYIVTQDNDAEFKIIVGGPGGNYASSGTYESTPFDAQFTTAFNRLIPTANTPTNTSAEYQIAIADAINDNCNDSLYEFVGPDGTNQTFYTMNSHLLLDDSGSGYENPGRCMKYRVYLATSDSSSTPIFEEIQINYAP
ncbi:prepilin-type N-terminal cleavage/methylation domain-containing protein [Candidatus Woesebacteria bacterium]|nr:prepilin-type N-terminal cleavage/methylation domain-containing protein [Candidatus Woesebacteria bacterium]